MDRFHCKTTTTTTTTTNRTRQQYLSKVSRPWKYAQMDYSKLLLTTNIRRRTCL